MNSKCERVDFDDVAQNLTEVIDAILTTPRDRERRIELIRHQVRRAIVIGYRARAGR
jgi:hypothetical protein